MAILDSGWRFVPSSFGSLVSKSSMSLCFRHGCTDESFLCLGFFLEGGFELRLEFGIVGFPPRSRMWKINGLLSENSALLISWFLFGH
ncbi:unnamed protein product [Cuscuta campestris]|uniref:Uncharacterized protein n=1 Tax=Cuscuta campestris TaxID=132261 RepID=A0A484MYC5_9ASTE|nr:unnamed protein product [Cuscuta campestris]